MNDRAIDVKLRSGMAGVIREFLDASGIRGNRRGRWNLEVRMGMAKFSNSGADNLSQAVMGPALAAADGL